jgi:hypothetical protein
MAVWYILWSFGFFPVLVSCTKKNLATLPAHSLTQCCNFFRTHLRQTSKHQKNFFLNFKNPVWA